jgi:hypothetical protein
VSTLPHPSWCSHRWCTATTDVDGEGEHWSAPVVVNGTGRIPAKFELQILRVDSADFGWPWVYVAIRDTQVMLKIADARRLAALLVELADKAERSETQPGGAR